MSGRDLQRHEAGAQRLSRPELHGAGGVVDGSVVAGAQETAVPNGRVSTEGPRDVVVDVAAGGGGVAPVGRAVVVAGSDGDALGRGGLDAP